MYGSGKTDANTITSPAMRKSGKACTVGTV